MPHSHCTPLLLGSASPARAELLKAAGFVFDVQASGADEPDRFEGETLEAYVLRLSRLKAKALHHAYPDHYILTADTAIELDGHTLGKPGTHVAAIAMIQKMAGRTHSLCSGTTLTTPEGRQIEGTDSARIEFIPLNEAEIKTYVDRAKPYHVAGAYALQGAGKTIVKSIEGREDTIIGMCIPLVQKMIQP